LLLFSLFTDMETWEQREYVVSQSSFIEKLMDTEKEPQQID